MSSFMKPQITETDYYLADTSHGDEIIPADVINLPLAVGEIYTTSDDGDDPEWFHDVQIEFVAGELYSVERQHGFIARMSAPGYMDCTEWSAHTTYDEAAEYLDETYGEEDD